MSFFDPKSFSPESGKSVFGSIFDQFTNTRFKLGAAAYERQLKAADPSNKLKLLRDKVKERDNLVSEMVKLQATAARSARGSVSERFTPGRPSPYVRDDRRANKETLQNRNVGRIKADTPQVATKAEQIVTAYRKDKDAKNFNTELTRLLRGVATSANLKTNAERYGFREGVRKAIVDQGGDKATREILGELYDGVENQDPLVLSDDEKELFTEGVRPSGMTRAQEIFNASQRTGGRSISRKLGTPIDISKELQFFKDRVEQLDGEIKDLSEDYEVASQEYERLLRGPDRNLMTAPVAFRPSRTGEIIDSFGNLVAQDPGFAREMTAASQEAGRFTVPKPYEELLSVPGAGGKSAFDVMLEQSDLVGRLGLGSVLDDEVSAEISDEDVNLIAGSVSKMRKALASQMSDTTDIGTMKMGLASGVGAGDLNARQAIETFDDLLQRLKDNPTRRRLVAKDAMSAIQSWEGSLTPDMINEKSRQMRPGMAIATKIRKASDEYNNFERTGDARSYRQTLSTLYNDLKDTDEDVRGAVGNAVLNEIDMFIATDESDRRPGELNFKLSGIADVAETLASRDVAGVETFDLEPMKARDREVVVGVGSEQETDPSEVEGVL